MKKNLIIITSVVILLLNVFSSLPVSAYIAPDALFNKYTSRSQYLTAPTDGIYLIYTPYVCKINPSAPGLSLLTMLDKSYLSAGAGDSTFTWQGVERDSDITLTDVSDVVGFSQTYAYSTTNSAFVYSIITCIPVVEGDSFRFNFLPNSDFVINSPNNTYVYYSFLSYCTGVSNVSESFSSTSSECKYITKSDNQHFACFNNPDGALAFGYPNFYSTSSSNLSSIFFYNFCDLYTTTYGLSKNSEISVTPNSNVIDFSFSVYEIFTDGTTTPGIGDSGGGSSGGTVGDITVNVDMTETNSKLDTLIAAVQALPSEIWDCFKVGLGISDSSGGSSSGGTSGGSSSILPPSDGDMKVELDPEELGSTLDTVNDDFSSMLVRTRGAFHFFWKFVDNFFTSINFYGLAGISLIFTLVIWLLNR